MSPQVTTAAILAFALATATRVDISHFGAESVQLSSPRTIVDDRPATTAHEQGNPKTQTAPPPPPILCDGPSHTLLLENHTVLTNVRWRVRNGNSDGTDRVGCGTAIRHRTATGHFWFFDSENIELTCKALNGTSLTGAYWVFCGSLTDVEWWMEAVNNADPAIRHDYYNPPGSMASFGDVNALAVGSNTAPTFSALNCGQTFEVPRDPHNGGSLSVFVSDADGDALYVSVRVLEGNPALSLQPQWSNPIAGSGNYIQTAVHWPDEAADYIIGIEATDQKSLLPTLCTVGLEIR